MRITVIVADSTPAIHVGGEVERYAKTFVAPPVLAAYIDSVKQGNAYASVSLAVEEESQ